MIWKSLTLFLAFNFFLNSNAAFVDTVTKCSMNDYKCHKELLTAALAAFAKDGIPEVGLSSIDPCPMKNLTVKILNVIDVTLIDGYSKGVKDCVVDRFEANTEKGKSRLEITCDLLIVNGSYKLLSTNPLLKNLLGSDSVRGDGNGTVKIEKLKFNVDLVFNLFKRGEDIFAKFDLDKLKYGYDIKKRISLKANNIFVADKESSKVVTNLINENWKSLMTSFGEPFVRKAVDYVMGVVGNYFDVVSVTKFVIEDLSPYVKK